MNTHQWIARLTEQLPGWVVWYSGTPGRGWYAIPAPAGTQPRDPGFLRYRLGPYLRPQDLRTDARQRYGWGDHCQSCGGPWQDCGHRMPEARVRP